MHRADKMISSRGEIDEVIFSCRVCHLGLARDNIPYVVPVSFGYDGESIYVHTAREGLKIEHFLANPNVCVQFERGTRVRGHPDTACRWTVEYESVIGFGRVAELTAPEDKSRGLAQIMAHYSGMDGWAFDPAGLERTRVWKITIESLTGKRS
jgi:hypothetical protein